MALKSNRKFRFDPILFPRKARELGYNPDNLTEEQIVEILNHLDPHNNRFLGKPRNDKK